ncbi:MORC family CW-type zinc finger protein 3 isoform X1 [Tachysurus fulvidraco]|uniref:MORC family CW-type zinc finger protein 3 isoform X1 n=1 Tax=Tachysurus fulvidraco TaxID=1234273 RepID=UPI001FEFF2AF|nr:MORC family CW-type zinc finger protein 3 isoform X1 [Tachysurus fulvidraco]
MARLSEHGIRLSSMSPSYLNSNSTSHTWPFSAVAELIDNASDPGVTAKQIWIDVVTVKEELCLTFTDNGSGMTPSKLHKMLSFGFTEKGSGKGSHQAIGIYGNGFKSGSMRLGRDALIFTKNGGCQSVGMLSQTFLHDIKAQAVIVPIAPFNQQTKSLVITEDSEASLRAILTHSLFHSESELQEQLDTIPGKKGTKILIWNIRRNKDGKPEFDFEVDKEDIRLPEIHSEEMEGKAKRRYSGPQRTDHIIPEMDYSLRAYLSILYLKPRIQIILRGKKVQTKLVAKSLSMIENDVYKPQFINERVKITFGFNHKNKDHYGIMMYHNNRLIKSYEKVGCQIKSSGLRSGVGVIGVIECNFLKPAHNKQDFEYTKEYRLTMAALGNKLNDYWREKKEKKAKERAFRALERKSIDGNTEEYDESEEEEEEDEEENEEEEMPNVMWLQCDDCMKWRGIPRHLFKNNLPEHFTCSQHPIGRMRSCLVPEEPEEPEDELTPSYEKTHKKQEVWTKRRGKSVESHKVPMPPECKETPEPTSEATPDETVITIETETQSKDDETTPSQHHCNKRKGTWTNEEISSKSPKRTDSEKEISTTTNESEEQAMEENLEILEAKSNDQTVKNANDEAKSTVVSPDTESTNPTSSEQQVSRAAQTKEQPKPAIGPQGWPHPITPHTSMAWSHPLPPAQTVVVPPLSRTSRQPHTVLRLENPDRSVLTSRLDQLEREAKRLRRILGLREAVVQMSPLSDGEVSGSAGTVQDGKTDSGTSIEANATAVASKKSGPQPDQQSILKSALSPAGQQEALVTLADDLHWSKTLAKLQSQNQALCTELNQVKTENDELQSKLRQTERETRDKREQSTNTPSSIHDSIALDRLRSIRRNVVSLLSSILPNLDMQGISYDTGDVDSILQQIIQANNL